MDDTQAFSKGKEHLLDPEDIIVSKTDLRGIITYSNSVFHKISGYTEAELQGQPHNIIRHPSMPASVFDLLWETIQKKQEIFAYVINLTKHGDYYWVFAHVTASHDLQGNHIGYHSNRRAPHRDALAKVIPLYQTLLNAEQACPTRKEGVRIGRDLIRQTLESSEMDYSEFVFSLSESTLFDSVCKQPLAS